MSVTSSALVCVSLVDGRKLSDVRAWLAEVDRLNLPDDSVMLECYLAVDYLSEVLSPIEGESELGVEGVDILVGLPR